METNAVFIVAGPVPAEDPLLILLWGVGCVAGLLCAVLIVLGVNSK